MKIGNQLKLFFSNPFIVAIFITIGTIAVLPNFFEKFELNIVEEGLISPNRKIQYVDLNDDGKSEKFEFFTNSADNFAYTLHDGNSIIVDQFNFSTKSSNYNNIWFQDANENGIKELYALTISNDSVFLNIHEHFSKEKIWQERIFVDTVNPYKGLYNFRSSVDENSKILDRKDILFCINVGFGASPRNIYKYDYENGSFSKSPHLINTSSLVNTFNFSLKDYAILISSSATSNDLNKLNIKKSDYNTWITALDKDLNYLFSPIEIKSKGIVKPLKIEENNQFFFLFSFWSRDKKIPSKILKVNIEGAIIDELVLPEDYSFYSSQTEEESFFIINKKENKVDFYNSELQLENSVTIPFSGYIIIQEDFNNNGNKEFIVFNNFQKKLAVYTSDFSEFVIKDYKDIFIRDYGFRLIDGKKQLYIVQKNKISFFEYSKNKYYYLKYLAYLFIYILVMLFIFIIIKGQQIREGRKRKIEQQIIDLQLKNIKNQVDSHFVFNALNVISDISLSGNKTELEKFIYTYSKFMRKTLDNSDKIFSTINEEIDLVESFLKLQQIRFNYKFGYTVNIQKGINTNLKIPKHCMFTYVENAVKYGLPTKEKGNLSINIEKKQNAIYIYIRDNGGGFSKNKNKSNGTKKGLRIMDKIFALYQDRFKTSINYTIEEIGKGQEKEGVLVTIKIKI